jgi:hypothetical protein
MSPRDRQSKPGRFAVLPAAKASPREHPGPLLVSITLPFKIFSILCYEIVPHQHLRLHASTIASTRPVVGALKPVLIKQANHGASFQSVVVAVPTNTLRAWCSRSKAGKNKRQAAVILRKSSQLAQIFDRCVSSRSRGTFGVRTRPRVAFGGSILSSGG